jgi:hypothetical protein
VDLRQVETAVQSRHAFPCEVLESGVLQEIRVEMDNVELAGAMANCVDQCHGAHLCRSVLALGPDAQVEYKSAKTTDHDDVVRKHIKKVGPVTVDYTFARECASMIDMRAQTAGKAS